MSRDARRRQKLVDARREAAIELSDAKRLRQDTQAAIRRAESRGDEWAANSLRASIPKIEADISRAAWEHERADRAIKDFDRRSR